MKYPVALSLLFAVSLGACAPATMPASVTPPSPSSTGPAPAPSKPPTPDVATSERLVTVYPYVVSDGMEYGPSQIVVAADGTFLGGNVAGLPNGAGTTHLVAIESNDPMPKEYESREDFVWPDWKVARMIKSRTEDPKFDWDGFIARATVRDTANCLKITVHAFETYTFCGSISGYAPSARAKTDGGEAVHVLLDKDFYPYPKRGADRDPQTNPALTATVVPSVAPLK